MASSFQDNPYRRPNFAADGATPSYLRRPQVPPIPPIFTTGPTPWPQPPGPIIPFPAPLPRPPHDVDPPERNPYNDPDYIEPPYLSPFLVTGNPSTRATGSPQGGLLGRLVALL